MRVVIIFVSVFFIYTYSNAQTLQDSASVRTWMVGSELGFLFYTYKDRDYTNRTFNMRIGPKFGYFIGQNTLLGATGLHEFTRSNYDQTFPTYWGANIFLRQYIPRWDVDWQFRLSKEGRPVRLRFLPLASIVYSRGNFYYNNNGEVVYTKHLQASDIAIEAGAALKLWRELYLAIYPGVAYSFDNQKLRLYRGASFEYYFHKNKNHKS